MFLKKTKKSDGRVFLSFVQGYREGKSVKHKTIEKIGYLDDLMGVYEDPIAYFGAVAAEKNQAGIARKTIEISAGQKLPNQANLRKNLGYAITKRVYVDLGLYHFLQNKQKHLKAEYNLNSIFSLLVFNRLLFPSSKKHAFEQRAFYFDSFDFTLADVYRALDYFANYSEAIQKHLHQKVSATVDRDDELGYYDVTNYYFEIPYNDEDVYDENGNLLRKGFRKKGPSKEHRPDPIVQMGLLMDSNGIPMAFNTFSGAESEKNSMLPTLRRVKRDLGLKRIIVVADRGLNTSDNTAFLSGRNDDDSHGRDGYVYGQSVLGADKEFKAWVLDRQDYVNDMKTDAHGNDICAKDGTPIIFTHKSRVYAKSIQLQNSQGSRCLKMTIYQKQMVYFSQKYANKQRKERALAVAKAKDLIANPGKYTKATSYGSAGYVKNLKFVKDTGEVADGAAISLNLEKIMEEEKYDGFYSIVTSEKHLDDKEIRDIYKGLWEIEESFKIIKSEFRARPVYLRLEQHINAHFLICFVALVIPRVLEYRLDHKFTIGQIRDSLIRYSCSHLDQNYYLFDYRDDVLRCVEDVFGFDLGNKIMATADIKKILKASK